MGRVRAALVPHFAPGKFLLGCLAGPHITPSPEPEALKFLWVTEFPLFTRADEDKDFLAHGRWSSSHHPFTAPMVEDLALLQGQGNSGLSKVRLRSVNIYDS